MKSPRINNALTKAFAEHAAWCRTGRAAASAKALMAAITGKPTRSVIPLEERIEAALMGLASRSAVTADVFRMEYGAGWQHVFKRRRKSPNRFLWLEATTEDKAAVLDISPATYKAHLEIARNDIYAGLTQ